MGVTCWLILLLPAILSSPLPDPDPAYGIIKTIKVFDEDANSTSLMRNEIFTDFLEDEDMQVLSKETLTN